MIYSKTTWRVSTCEKFYGTNIKSAVLYPLHLLRNCDDILRWMIHLCKTCPMKWTLCLAAGLKIAWQIAYSLTSEDRSGSLQSKVKAVIRQATISKDEIGRVTDWWKLRGSIMIVLFMLCTLFLQCLGFIVRQGSNKLPSSMNMSRWRAGVRRICF